MIATPPPADHSESVLRRLIRQIRAGWGQGRWELYKAWLPIRRRSSSTVSHQVLKHLPIAARSYNLLSLDEENAALVISWLGAQEIREGLPMWPGEHRNPAAGIDPDLDRRLGNVRGLLDIAREAGIDHGDYPGTSVPYIGTIDLAVLLPPLPRSQLLFVGCKPSEMLLNDTRAVERLELERRYASACGGTHCIVHDLSFDAQLLENLRWIAPSHSELNRWRGTPELDDFCGEFIERCSDRAITVAREEAARAVGLVEAGERMFRAGLWMRLIDADLSLPIVRSWPLRRDHGRIAREARAALNGTQE